MVNRTTDALATPLRAVIWIAYFLPRSDFAGTPMILPFAL
jgi:hypothetical protein